MKCSSWNFLLPLIFLGISLPIFMKIYETSKLVIDEEFHLRQGLNFCKMRFFVWDKKITTFPGLYLLTVVLNPIGMCKIFGLRLLSLIAASINVVLFYQIRRFKNMTEIDSALDAISLAILPPLYFFSHIYYTDVISLTFVLLFYYSWLKDARKITAIFGAASVLMRQTNIIWVAMTAGITGLSELYSKYVALLESKRIVHDSAITIKLKIWVEVLTSMKMLFSAIWRTIIKCSLTLLIIFPFVLFVLLNGSIVVGDKQAHTATLHIPQLFYFSLFTLTFGLSSTLQYGKSVLRYLWQNKFTSIFFLVMLMFIVKWNTLVHPYLLADNRHYTFYVWNRFYGRYTWFKYAVTPVYLFGLTLMYQSLRCCPGYFQLMFWCSVLLVLCFQRLLELRYFLIPFVLFRLNSNTERRRSHQFIELSYYIVLNAVTLFIFFTKEITWKDYKQPQRIIW